MLAPGERVEEVFLAQVGPNPNVVFLSYFSLFFNHYRVIAVTDRAIVVCAATFWRPTFPTAVIERLSRSTQLGPLSGTLWSQVRLPGKRTWVHRRFHDDVLAADLARPRS